MKKLTATVGCIFLFLIILCAVLYHLVWNGIILLNNPSEKTYPVRGVDVSHYQGEIDWQILSSQNIDFAFIKATEGSSFTDECFEYNFSEAQKCSIDVGAYHFFSFDSKGVAQAEHFIKTVVPFEGMLPPVVDFEFHGMHLANPPEKEKINGELCTLLELLEAHYGLKPIIYAAEDSYEHYLSGGFEKYHIWIRNVKTTPKLPDGRRWTFWQYTNRERLDGYSGEEKFVDMNVFCGSREEFLKLPRYSDRFK